MFEISVIIGHPNSVIIILTGFSTVAANMARKEKLMTFLATEEHFRNEDGFMELIRRIQHFGLDKYGVIHVKVPDSVTVDQRKKLVPLLDKLKLKVSSWANFK